METELTEEIPLQETPDKRIRVQVCTEDCAMIPQSLLRRIFKELKGTRCIFFLYIWKKTISQDTHLCFCCIEEALKEINSSERSIINAISFLEKHNWLVIYRMNEEGFGKDDGTYSIASDILQQSGCLPGVSPYHAYLLSPRWKKTRQKALERAENKCEQCGSIERLEVHHLTYKNVYHEELEDLQVICHDCHTGVHGMEVE